MTDAQIAAAPKRVMDCVDCHNRPTHIYQPPDRAVDRSMLGGQIPRDLPWIKSQAVAALTRDYATTEQAVEGIANDITAFYRKDHPDVFAQRRPDIDRAVAQVQTIFRTIRFPEMKVDWRTHPDNVGHLYSPGCFRCHNGQHKAADGSTLTNECEACHDLIGQREGTVVMVNAPSGDFQHPIDLGDLREVNCSTCHTGGGM
jgi:hypothetical protein